MTRRFMLSVTALAVSVLGVLAAHAALAAPAMATGQLMVWHQCVGPIPVGYHAIRIDRIDVPVPSVVDTVTAETDFFTFELDPGEYRVQVCPDYSVNKQVRTATVPEGGSSALFFDNPVDFTRPALEVSGADQDVWYTDPSGLSVTLAAMDAETGVHSMECMDMGSGTLVATTGRIDPSPGQKAVRTLTISDLRQGTNDLVFRARDWGECYGDGWFNGAAENRTVRYDSVRPMPGVNVWASKGSDAQLMLGCADDTSAMSRLMYQLDDQPVETVWGGGQYDYSLSAPILTVSQYGPHTVKVWGFDNAGNRSEEASATFFVDNDVTAPQLQVDGLGETWRNGADANVRVTASDDGGRPVRVSALCSGGIPWIVAPFEMDVSSGASPIAVLPTDLPDGKYTVSISARDESENSVGTSGEFWKDTLPPTADVNVWPTTKGSDTQLALGCADYTSAIDRVMYQVDDQPIETIKAGNAGDYSIGAEMTFSDYGPHTIRVWGFDNAGNRSEEASATFFVGNDVTAPQLRVEGLGETWRNGADAKVRVTASDDSGGLVRLNALFSGGTPWSDSSVDLTVDPGASPVDVLPADLPDGKFMVNVTARDESENSAGASGEFWKDTVAPEVRIDTFSDASGGVEIRPLALDATSRPSELVYQVDDGAPVTVSASGQPETFLAESRIVSARGAHSVSASALDVAGNRSATTTVDFTVGTSTHDVTERIEPHGIELDFAQVDAEGVSSATAVAPAQLSAAPSGKRFVAGSSFDISTAKTFAGAVRVSVPYDPAALAGAAESDLRLLHWDGASWVDITEQVDTANHRVIGTTYSFSPFAIAAPTSGTTPTDPPTPPNPVVSSPASSSWSVVLLAGLALGGAWRHRRRRALDES